MSELTPAKKQPRTLRVSGLQALGSIGPAMVIAAVVLGPGSITTASRVGCGYGYSVGWVLAAATILMIGMTLAALLAGIQTKQTAVSRVRARFGKTAAISLGLVVFLIVALFQSSNNRAMLLAAEVFYPEVSSNVWLSSGLLVGLNMGIVLFFLFSPNVYKIIERSMMLLVGTMLVCFGVNAVSGGVSLTGMISGLVPTSESVTAVSRQLTGDLRGMVATTFSVAGAFYQCYLVQERGWTRDQFRIRWIDPVIGISTLGLLTMLIMGTAAASLHGKVQPDQITDLSGLADTLRPTFGPVATFVFAAGIMAGAISSFVGNALVGGTIFSDALKMGASAKERGPRLFTVAALLVGMVIALGSVLASIDSVAFIIIAQGLTTLGLPVMALVILWMLVHSKDYPKSLLVVMILGVIVACYTAAATLWSLAAKLSA